MLFLFVLVARAAAPDAVFPVLAPFDAPAQWAEAGHPSPLACDVLWPRETLVCFRVQEGNKRRFVTEADLAQWAVDVVALRAAVTQRAREKLVDQPKSATIEGTQKTYWTSAEGDGWSAAGVLAPELVAMRLGGPFMVAVPTDRVLLAWRPGDPDLDKIMAVGVKEMFEAADWPVTAVVHRWDGARFTAYVEAVPAPTLTP